MSGPDLARLRELSEAATPAPWHVTDGETLPDLTESGVAVVAQGDYDPPPVALICDEWYENDPGEPSPSDDAFLIAAMRNALPALLDLVDAQASEIAAQAKQLDDVRALADSLREEALRYQGYAVRSNIPRELLSIAKTLDGTADQIRAITDPEGA